MQNPAEPMLPPTTMQPEPLWRVGGDTDAEGEFFGVISDIEIAPNGDVYLLDMQLDEVKVFSGGGEYLRTMYYDTLVFTSEALRHLATEVGVSQLVIGTDHPIPWQDKSVDHILNTPGFTDEERRAMLGETAAKLLGIPLA